MKRRNFRITIVTFSILLMTCSALISYSLVRSNDDQIANLQFEIKKKQETIDNVWEGSLNQEVKIDNAVLISILSKNHKKDYSKIIKYYTGSIDNSIDDLEVMLETMERDRKYALNKIDDLYGEKVVAENEVMARSKENKLYTAIAIFFQLLSVILVTISRDVNI